MLKHLFPKESIDHIANLSKLECKQIFFWWADKDLFNSLIDKKAIEHFSSLSEDYIRNQFNHILKNKKVI